MISMASEYQQSMFDSGDLRLLRMLATPFLYLTTMLPPSMYGELVQQNDRFELRLVRTKVNRLSIAYAVFCQLPESTMMD